MAANGVDGRVYRVWYVSTDEQGRRVPVTGLVFVPLTPAPAGGYNVVDWAHGTVGMADPCAPSLDPETAVPFGMVNDLLAKNWVVTASDYQGMGSPPGLLAYLVGDLSARNTLDIALAAQHLPLRVSDNVVVWGHSEGGQTAMFAWNLAASYTPQLHLRGTVAGAPPSQFAYIYDFLKTSPFRFYLFMAAVGYHEAYGSKAPLAAVLTPKALALLPKLTRILRAGCPGTYATKLDRYRLSELVKKNPFDVPAWKKLMQANDPGNLPANGVPLLVLQGGNDQQIPTASTLLLAQKLCAGGQDLERWIYPGLTHAGVMPVYAPDMVQWIADRFATAPSPDPMQPTGEAGIQTSTCPS